MFQQGDVDSQIFHFLGQRHFPGGRIQGVPQQGGRGVQQQGGLFRVFHIGGLGDHVQGVEQKVGVYLHLQGFQLACPQKVGDL